MKKITIILTVYNAFEFLEPCIKSILKHTTNIDYELLILDDASPDSRVKKYLDTLDYPHVKAITNEKNLGFVGNNNQGIEMAEGDVVLLNSDTEVTKGWLKKLSDAAYSDKRIGSVTPFTNNGFQVSVPKQWEDNEIQKGFTVDSFGEFIEKISLKSRPRLATGAGFCLYLKRKVIDEIGVLDSKKFGKGYGEESDWCMRAHRAGYENILDDQTFVYHKGQMSFPDLLPNLDAHQLKNQSTFHKMYPETHELTLRYDCGEKVQKVIANIQLELQRRKLSESRKKNILFVSFDNLNNSTVGAFKHVKDIIQNLKGKYNFFNVYTFKNKLIVLRYKTIDDYEAYAFPVKKNYDESISKDVEFNFENGDIESTFSTILKLFSIDIVHFQHLQRLPLSLIKRAKEMRRFVMYTAHDFLLYCPKFDLVTVDSTRKFKFCGFETKDEVCKECQNYFFPNNNLELGYNKRRRKYIVDNILPAVDLFITPSEFVKNKLVEIYQGVLDPKKIKVIGHGLDISDVEIDKKKVIRVNNDKLNVAFLGVFNEIKGTKIFAELVNKLHYKVNFFVFGREEDALTLSKIKGKCHYYGAYKNDEAIDILRRHNIDLGLILSVAEESFSLTLSEFWAAKVPVLALDTGAVGERIREVGTEELLVEKKDPIPALVRKIEEMIGSPKLLEEYRNQIPDSKTIKQNMEEYDILYKGIMVEGMDEDLDKEEREKVSMAYVEYKTLVEKGMIKEKYERSPAELTFANKCFIFLSRIGLANVLKPFYRKIKKVSRK